MFTLIHVTLIFESWITESIQLQRCPTSWIMKGGVVIVLCLVHIKFCDNKPQTEPGKSVLATLNSRLSYFISMVPLLTALSEIDLSTLLQGFQPSAWVLRSSCGRIPRPTERSLKSTSTSSFTLCPSLSTAMSPTTSRSCSSFSTRPSGASPTSPASSCTTLPLSTLSTLTAWSLTPLPRCTRKRRGWRSNFRYDSIAAQLVS